MLTYGISKSILDLGTYWAFNIVLNIGENSNCTMHETVQWTQCKGAHWCVPTFKRKTGERETWITKGKSVVCYNRYQVSELGDDQTCQMMLCAQVKSECC